MKGLPLAARNFEVEVELTVKTTQRSYRLAEVPIEARPRTAGGAPRLRVIHDGFRILWAIGLLYRDYRPMSFFGFLGSLMLGASLGLEVLGADDHRQAGPVEVLVEQPHQPLLLLHHLQQGLQHDLAADLGQPLEQLVGAGDHHLALLDAALADRRLIGETQPLGLHRTSACRNGRPDPQTQNADSSRRSVLRRSATDGS